jgi:hypothetical protein
VSQRAPRKAIPDLGRPHRRDRTRLLANHIDGSPCPCLDLGDCGTGCPCRRAGHGLPMYRSAHLNVDGAPLEADHTTPRSLGGKRADRLLLRCCNRSRGNGTRAAQDTAADGGYGGNDEQQWNERLQKPVPEWWSRDWLGAAGLDDM